MELKDFIKSSITSIIESIEELNEELKDKGVIVAPRDGGILINGSPVNPIFTTKLKEGRNELIYNIDFSLSVSESKSYKAGGDAKIYVIGGGLSKKAGTKSLNNIKFSIPIVFPH
jgi:hypothetical protein